MIDEIDRTGGALLCLRNITKEYQTGEGVVRALDQVCLTVDSGDFVVIVGPSGSGKSTLLNTAGLIDKQTTGEYLLDGVDVSGLSGDAVAMLRCHNLGILLQHHCLLPKLSAVENVELAGIYAGSSGPVRRREAEALLGRLGLYHRSEHRPDELSGGELQRVALARALMNGRRIVLADEPTASLDAAAAENIS